MYVKIHWQCDSFNIETLYQLEGLLAGRIVLNRIIPALARARLFIPTLTRDMQLSCTEDNILDLVACDALLSSMPNYHYGSANTISSHRCDRAWKEWVNGKLEVHLQPMSCRLIRLPVEGSKSSHLISALELVGSGDASPSQALAEPVVKDFLPKSPGQALLTLAAHSSGTGSSKRPRLVAPDEDCENRTSPAGPSKARRVSFSHKAPVLQDPSQNNEVNEILPADTMRERNHGTALYLFELIDWDMLCNAPSFSLPAI
jgi:hypothetical protein